VGTKPLEMFGMMKHSNYFNLIISKAFRYFEPELVWKEESFQGIALNQGMATFNFEDEIAISSIFDHSILHQFEN
jgi:hypothetical protein